MMAFFVSIAGGILPMFSNAVLLYWLDRHEKEPLPLLEGCFLWGSFAAAAGAFVNITSTEAGLYLLTRSVHLSRFTVTGLFAPAVVETLKGFAVLSILWVFFSEYDSILDGRIYAGIAALRFAALENRYYMNILGFLEGGWAGLWDVFLLRSCYLGWTHPF